MSTQNDGSDGTPRTRVAMWTLGVSGVAIVALGIVAIVVETDNAMTILNAVLPMVASWVGTILAFYFGRENFESANRQVRELVQRLTPEERAKTPVTGVMRRLTDMKYFKMEEGKSDQDVTVAQLKDKLSSDVSRLPVLEADEGPKYMIHQSRIANFLLEGGKETDTLATFIDHWEKQNLRFGENNGFVVVSEKAALDEAKRKLDDAPTCQDIFVTKGGTVDEPLIGWISNARLARYLEA